MEHTKARSFRKLMSLWLWWMLVTAAGGTVIGALSAPTDFFWYIIMTGLVVGVAQWLVLRRYISHSGWWVLASAIGGAVHGAVGSAVCAVACQVGGAALSSGAGWAGNGAVTGIMLVWLLPNGIKMEHKRSS
jgi:hypothetical protein